MKLITGMPHSAADFFLHASIRSTMGYGTSDPQEPGVRYWLNEPGDLTEGLKYWTLPQTREYLKGLRLAFPEHADREPVLKHEGIIRWLPEVIDFFSDVLLCARAPASWLKCAEKSARTRQQINYDHPFYTNAGLTEGEELQRYGEGFFLYCAEQAEALCSQAYEQRLHVFDFTLSDSRQTLQDFMHISESEAEDLCKEFQEMRWEGGTL